jgi:hypothetical protein
VIDDSRKQQPRRERGRRGAHGLGEGAMLCPDRLVRLGIASGHGAPMAVATRREWLSRAGGSHHRAQSGGPGAA